MFFVGTSAALIGGLADTSDRRERSVDEPDHLADGDILGWSRQEVAAVFTAPALKVAGGLQLH